MSGATTKACALAAGLALLLAACRVGPEYETPPAPLAADWLELRPAPAGAASDATSWWLAFEDAALTALIERARTDNPTLRAAAARVLEARALLDVASGNLWPQDQRVEGGVQRTGFSRDIAGPVLPRVTEESSIGVAASWELDLWGRLRRAVEAADAELDAAVADRDDVLVLLFAEVARAYVDLRTFDERLRYARENVRVQRETHELAQVKFEEGAVSALDVEQALTILAQTEALIPTLEAGRRRAEHALALLTGRPPVDLDAEVGAGDIPAAPVDVAVGLPADLLRQRPDVRAAERRLAAQSARIGIATAELYPRLSLGGSLGWAGEDGSDLFDAASLAGLIGVGIDWKVLNYGRLRGAIDAEEARFESRVQQYVDAVLAAQREVADALVTLARQRERVAALARGVEAAASSAALVSEQYREGRVEYTRVFVAQTTLVDQQDLLADARGQLAAAFIDVYRALGGGWEVGER